VRNSGRLPRQIHLVGIGGAGMSGLAHCLLTLNHKISGSDLQRSAATDNLTSLGATVFHDHSAENLADVELVVASDAISPYNSELEEARRRDIPILRRAEVLDRLSASKTAIFVAGSHGKSTTSGMITKVLEVADVDPSFVIGGSIPSLQNQRARIGRGAHFVAEACEAFQNLAFYHPSIALITNIDDEHTEHYGSQELLDCAFRDFAARVGARGAAIVNGDDAGVRRILPGLDVPVTTFGLNPENDICGISLAGDEGRFQFEVLIRGEAAGTITLPFPGEHAVRNALGCVAACLALDIPFSAITEGLAAFTGVSRRWEDHGLVNGVHIVDDYAHHPNELAAVIQTARSLVANNGRLVVAFQPQLFSRTRRLYRDFAAVLAGCDRILLLEIDPAGERDTGDTRSDLILNEIQKKGRSAELLANVDELVDHVPRAVCAGDLLLIAGAGSIRAAAKRLCRSTLARQVSLRGSANSQHDTPAQSRPGIELPENKLSKSVIALFQEQVRRRPTGCAISDRARSVSYKELDDVSDALCDVLRKRGAVPGVPVGVRLPASIDLIIAMVAIMKAGAVYLPLDGSLPLERISYMLENAGARLIIASSDITLTTDAFETLYLDALQADIDNLPPANARENSNRPFPPDGDGPAYICFTSGSTGYPKGIAIRHEALCQLISDITERFHIGAATKTVVNTSISFDVSLAELWMTLCGGGELVVSGSSKPMVGDRLGRFLDENKITHLTTTPSVLASVRARPLLGLRCIVAVGEACPQDLVDTWAPGRLFFNAYGPTEATVYATVALCQRGVPVTIGKALNHIDTYVLDDNLKPVPQGEVGELCLGGAGVAEKYFTSEEESRKRFVTLQSDGQTIDRIYRTGDLVRREIDGNLAFLGRADNQIKIRGNRVEIEEIEHSIQRLPGVLEVAVCIDKNAGAHQLICFVVMAPDHSFDDGAMAERLSSWLPSYMVPSHFVRVDAIPLTASGKKDRRSLLPKHRKFFVQQMEYEGPRNDTETKLAVIWKRVLETDRDIGVYDTFASHGGDSLKSLMLIMEVEKQFKVSIPPGYFGRISTIYRMAVQLADLLWIATNSRASARIYRQMRDLLKYGWSGIQFKSGNRGAESSIHGFRSTRIYKQLRDLTAAWPGKRVAAGSLISSLGNNDDAVVDLFVCLQMEAEYISLAEHLGKTFRVHSMRSGHLVMDYVDSNVERLASYYIKEIDQIKPRGKLVIAGICQGCTIAHAIAEKLRKRGEDVPLLVNIEAPRPLPFDGSVAFFYSDESPLNPKLKSGFARHDEVLGGRYSVDFLPGEHGTACSEPYVQILAGKLQGRLEPFL
jgi:UDP-N-acetylmuramate--L-alanine ligase